MAIQISVTGLTTQQQQDVANAFDETIGGREAAGVTKARWVELCMIRHIKAIVKGWRRKIHEGTITAEQIAVDTEYLE